MQALGLIKGREIRMFVRGWPWVILKLSKSRKLTISKRQESLSLRGGMWPNAQRNNWFLLLWAQQRLFEAGCEVSRSSRPPTTLPSEWAISQNLENVTVGCLNIDRDLLSGITHSWPSRHLVRDLHLWGSNILLHTRSPERPRTLKNSCSVPIPVSYRIIYLSVLSDQISDIVRGNWLALLCSLSSGWHQKGRRKEWVM